MGKTVNDHIPDKLQRLPRLELVFWMYSAVLTCRVSFILISKADRKTSNLRLAPTTSIRVIAIKSWQSSYVIHLTGSSVTK
jgi:hypothetical protein